MDGRNKTGDGGMALVIVLLMVSVIIAVTLELNIASRSEVYEAANFRDRLKALCLAKSGFYYAGVSISADTNNYDALFMKWAKPDEISSEAASLFDEGNFKLAIEDESGKIPINKLVADNDFNPAVKDIVVNLLSQPEFRLDEQKVSKIINAMKDYMDSDTELTGAEKGEKEPSEYKNAPFDCIENLLLIKDISRELYSGTADAPGIAKYMTVFGDGKININTAPKPVLKAFSRDMTDDYVNRMDDYRKSQDRDLSDPSWFRKIPGLAGSGINSALITTRSRIFRVTATGSYRGMSETVAGVVERGEGPKDLKTLFWKVSD